MVRLQKFVLLAVVLILIVGCDWLETFETTYPDFEAVIQEEGIPEKGGIGPGRWIPRFLPSSATDIIERHEIDTSERWLFFHFNPKDLTVMVSTCKEVTQSEVIYTGDIARSWWPGTLTTRSGNIHSQKTDYEYYQCIGRGTIAVNIEKKEVYFWSF